MSRFPAWRASKLPSLQTTRPFEHTGVLLPLAAVCALAVALFRVFGPIDAPYSWLRPITYLHGVLEAPDIVLYLVIAYAFGRFARLRSSADEAKRERVAWDIPLNADFALRAGAIAGAMLVADVLFFPRHEVHDRIALIFVAGMLAAPSATAIDGPKTTLARGVLEVVVVVASLLLVSYVFTVIKAHLFHFTDARDEVIARMESAIFGDPLHVRAISWGRNHPDGVVWLDRVYFRIFDHMLVVSLFLLGYGDRSMRHRYLASLCFCYLIGSLTYYVMPSVGPAFADPASYAHLRTLPLISNDVQRQLAGNTASVTAGTVDELPTYLFLAAMPSLHIAHELVMLYYSRASRAFFGLSVLFVVATSFAVLVLGFHYALDALGGLALAATSITLVERAKVRWLPKLTEPTVETEIST